MSDVNLENLNREQLIKRVELLQNKIARLTVGKGQRINAQSMSLFPTCSWDLETTNLAADFSTLICSTVKPLGGPPKTFRIDQSPGYNKDRANDKWVVTQTAKELQKYTIDIGYNTQRFDLPYLTSKMIYHGIDIKALRDLRHVDMIWAVRYRMRLRSARLDVATEFLETQTRKTPLIGKLWAQAATGNSEAIDSIVEHNIKDVIALEELAIKIAPLIDLKFFLIK